MKVNKKEEKIQPQPVKKIICPTCKEILLKIYPWALVSNPNQQTQVYCGKCQNKAVAKLKLNGTLK